MDKKIFVVGFAVECDDLRDHTKFTDYTGRIASRLRQENYDRMEKEIRDDYKKLGYSVEHIKKEKVYELGLLDLLRYAEEKKEKDEADLK